MILILSHLKKPREEALKRAAAEQEQVYINKR